MRNLFSKFFSRKPSNSDNTPVIIEFSIDEQMAMMQCFWQLFQAKPSEADSLYVENTITSGWEAKEINSNLTPLEKMTLFLDLHVKELHPWVICAVKLDPYEAFKKVSSFSEEKKLAFKKLVKQIVFYGVNQMYKASMAISLFDNTSIGYDINEFAE
jgi:hypothetical protein